MKVFAVQFKYLEKSMIPYLAAESAEDAVEAAKSLLAHLEGLEVLSAHDVQVDPNTTPVSETIN